MEIHLWRYSSASDSTLGFLQIDGRFACYTLEDEKRTVKVFGETRIPAGRYRLKLRTFGGHHERYSQKFPGLHKGMIELEEVPGFTDILIHIGNTDDDTAGCILVGDAANNNQITGGKLTASTQAYKRVYVPMAAAIEEEDTFLNIHDGISATDMSEDGELAVVNTEWLNVREDPGIFSGRKGVLSQFTVIRVIDSRASWKKINLQGWVSGQFLKTP